MALALFEVEDRAVAVERLDGVGRAWAFSKGQWREAPALVGKAYVGGRELTRMEFVRTFPKADLNLLPLGSPGSPTAT
jgi:hypothetical protein